MVTEDTGLKEIFIQSIAFAQIVLRDKAELEEFARVRLACWKREIKL